MISVYYSLFDIFVMLYIHYVIFKLVSIQLALLFDTMMTFTNGNIFRDTGHLCGEFIGHRWIPHTKASDAELWCFLWPVSE